MAGEEIVDASAIEGDESGAAADDHGGGQQEEETQGDHAQPLEELGDMGGPDEEQQADEDEVDPDGEEEIPRLVRTDEAQLPSPRIRPSEKRGGGQEQSSDENLDALPAGTAVESPCELIELFRDVAVAA